MSPLSLSARVLRHLWFSFRLEYTCGLVCASPYFQPSPAVGTFRNSILETVQRIQRIQAPSTLTRGITLHWKNLISVLFLWFILVFFFSCGQQFIPKTVHEEKYSYILRESHNHHIATLRRTSRVGHCNISSSSELGKWGLWLKLLDTLSRNTSLIIKWIHAYCRDSHREKQKKKNDLNFMTLTNIFVYFPSLFFYIKIYFPNIFWIILQSHICI